MTNEHFEPTKTGRRAVVRTAAWSVPAVTIASAAPAFAATGPANLSTSTAVMANVTRAVNGTGSKITIPGGTVTFRNTGGTAAEGIVATLSVTSGAVSEVYGMGFPSGTLAAFGVTVSGLGTSTVILTVPATLLTIPADGSDAPLGFDLAVDTTDQNALDFSVSVAPANSGTSAVFPTQAFPAL